MTRTGQARNRQRDLNRGVPFFVPHWVLERSGADGRVKVPEPWTDRFWINLERLTGFGGYLYVWSLLRGVAICFGFSLSSLLAVRRSQSRAGESGW